MDISGVAGQLSKWKAVTGQSWCVLCGTKELLVICSVISHGLGLSQVTYVQGGRRNTQQRQLWTRTLSLYVRVFIRVCVCETAREPGIKIFKKEHLNFYVSKVQNCMLCNCMRPGLRSTLQSLSTHALTLHECLRVHLLLLHVETFSDIFHYFVKTGSSPHED